MGKAHRFYEDHGNAYRSDGPSQDYAPAPRFTIETHDFAGRFVYEAELACKTATEACDRITYCADRANAFGATDEQLESLKRAAGDVECAIAKVIEQLAKRAQDRAAANHHNDMRGEVAA